MKNINVESKEIQDDLIELVGCHYIGSIEIEPESNTMSRVNVQHKGESSTHVFPHEKHNQFMGETTRGFLYEHDSHEYTVYMLMSSHHKGHEHISYVKMNDSLHSLLFKKYIKLK